MLETIGAEGGTGKNRPYIVISLPLGYIIDQVLVLLASEIGLIQLSLAARNIDEYLSAIYEILHLWMLLHELDLNVALTGQALSFSVPLLAGHYLLVRPDLSRLHG